MAARASPSSRRRPPFGVTAALAAVAVTLAHAGATAYSEGAPPAHTGGFGEPTCHRCHFDQPLNDAAGSLRLEGLPESYAPGGRYDLRIHVERAGLRKAGFQLASRFAAGPRHGKQAGHLRAVDDRVAVVGAAASAVEYAHHSREGSIVDPAGTSRWWIEWTAPETDEGSAVIFHLAANASNDDDSEFGDYIYTAGYRIPPRSTPP